MLRRVQLPNASHEALAAGGRATVIWSKKILKKSGVTRSEQRKKGNETASSVGTFVAKLTERSTPGSIHGYHVGRPAWCLRRKKQTT